LAVKAQLHISGIVAPETAIVTILTNLTTERIPGSNLERGVDWTSEERQQIFALRQAIQDKTTAGRREKKEDKRKKQGQAAQQQESLLSYQNMIGQFLF
jgi:hypothetical protein